jgi:peptidoglycan hydrolase-like protein with peptidoglycan-binding domain
MTYRRPLALLLLAAGLAAPATAQAALGDRTLHQGDRGPEVRTLQVLLVRTGFRTAADGVFGPGTVRAVRRFQRASRLQVSGRVGRVTVTALRAAAASGGAAPAPASPVPAKPAAAPAPAAAPLPAPGPVATVNPDGTATAPAGAPAPVVAVIAAANRIATLPYRYGGGHAKVEDTAYDCSGSVSYALIGAGLLASPMASGDFAKWGDAGAGQWITTYSNAGHIYMVVAGLRFDTSGRSKAGTRWQAAMRSSTGFLARHPAGL